MIDSIILIYFSEHYLIFIFIDSLIRLYSSFNLVFF